MYVLPKKATRTSILTLLVNMAFSKSTFMVCDILKTCQFIKNVPDEYYSSIHLTLSRSWRSKHAKNWYSGTIVNKLQVVNSTFFFNQNSILAVRGVNKRYFFMCCSLRFNHSTYCCSWQNSNQVESKVRFTPSAGMTPFKRDNRSSTSQRLNSTVIPMKSMGLCLTPLICFPQDPTSCNCIQT